MVQKAKRNIKTGSTIIFIFIIWTLLVKTVDVKPYGVNGTEIGFARLNIWFHKVCGVHLVLYKITDWAGLLAIFIGCIFAIIGFVQLVLRRKLRKVDYDILILGIYYIIIFMVYIAFENIYINFRPIILNGVMEKSYPSSTTLLTIGIILPFIEQVSRRCKNGAVKILICCLAFAFLIFMVVARLISGVHWLTDIVGATIICIGLFLVYNGCITLFSKWQIV